LKNSKSSDGGAAGCCASSTEITGTKAKTGMRLVPPFSPDYSSDTPTLAKRLATKGTKGTKKPIKKWKFIVDRKSDISAFQI
jgi:hypothetical protein